jgi:guanine nucleotide-binding protein G(i) subunit alpha
MGSCFSSNKKDGVDDSSGRPAKGSSNTASPRSNAEQPGASEGGELKEVGQQQQQGQNPQQKGPEGRDNSGLGHKRNNSVPAGTDDLTNGQTQAAQESERVNSVASSTLNNNATPPSRQLSSSSSSSGKQEIKILLLGSGESGKSTILKQMKIIHQNGYSQEELLMYKTTVYKNLVDCAKAIVKALAEFGLSVGPEDQGQEEQGESAIDEATDNKDENNTSTDNNETSTTDNADKQVATTTTTSNNKKVDPVTDEELQYILSYTVEPDPDTILDPELTRVVNKLWAHPVAKHLFAHKRSQFYIMDSAPYFFSHVDRIGHPDYKPTVADILRARIKTTGIYETRFDMGGMNILMYDVGGQRSERKKWIHCFDNVTLIIFCVALSEYDQGLLEESKQNRMAESLVLFDSVVNSRWFVRTSVVLFLNKIDVFTDKLPNSPLENYFPDYTGGNDINKAAKYILWRFTQLNRAGLNIYPHLTQATDTSNIRLVFAAVKETILQNALRDSGIL